MEKRRAELRELSGGLRTLGIELEETMLQREIGFLDELLRWSTRVNLTAIRNRQEAIEKHLIDSLMLLTCPLTGPLLDLGSGAGLPAIPLAIARPELQVVSVESVGKKVNFQKHIRRLYGLANLTSLNCRIENLPQERRYPLITARAFAPLETIVELAVPLLQPGGRLLLLRGRENERTATLDTELREKFRLRFGQTRTYCLPYSGAQRQILQIEPSD